MTDTPKPLRDRVGANLRAELARAHRIPADLADQVGVHQETVRRKIRGDVPITLDDVDTYAAALGVETDKLLEK